MKQITEKVISAYQDIYKVNPDHLVRAPGRVNLIGDHTDYNQGIVLPLAIDMVLVIAFRPRNDKIIHLHSLDFNETAIISTQDPGGRNGHWADYIRGTIWSLGHEGYDLQGWEGVIGGDIPIGAGLSSSAATEMAVALTCSIISEWKWKPTQIAKVCQLAETNWIGVQSGIMDQMVIGNAKEDHALLIDCRSLEMEHVPLPSNIRIAILDTNTRRELVRSHYDQRVAECNHAAKLMGLVSLRDLDYDRLEQYRHSLDKILYRRSRHVLTENDRVSRFSSALKQNHLDEAGRLLQSSHHSLRNDFEVSTRALDLMVESALAAPGCLGARMTGAGFGGCAIALIEREAEQDFPVHVIRELKKRNGLTPRIYLINACAGVSQVTPPYLSML